MNEGWRYIVPLTSELELRSVLVGCVPVLGRVLSFLEILSSGYIIEPHRNSSSFIADETQLYLSHKLNYSATPLSLHNYLCAIMDWMFANLLKFNSNKKRVRLCQLLALSQTMMFLLLKLQELHLISLSLWFPVLLQRAC